MMKNALLLLVHLLLGVTTDSAVATAITAENGVMSVSDEEFSKFCVTLCDSQVNIRMF